MARKLTRDKDLKATLNSLQKSLAPKYFAILEDFVHCYLEAVLKKEEGIKILLKFLNFAKEQFTKPYQFEPYHEKIVSPVDYHQFGKDFTRLLIDLENSQLFGFERLQNIQKALDSQENVILFANHQTEPDPQVISILLEKGFPEISASLIAVAGERVTTDPLAIPFSLGCNLICIYSKRYIDHPPEQKAEKQLHNKNAMTLMSSLLKEGGKIIYVAPSGGRDRKNLQNEVEVAPFDPDSIEMFYLMAKKAKTPTHFYPLALATYNLLPPPETIQKELGEKRVAKRTPVCLSFLPEIDMENFAFLQIKDKLQRRKKRAEIIWRSVSEEYKNISKEL